jgi:DUF4097 and DUF4098 domain-containing protein YvlB
MHSFVADEISQLMVNALAGSLEVTGHDVNTVTVNARVCSNKSKYLEQMNIDISETENKLELTVIIPYENSDWDADYAFVDLEVMVPRNLSVKLRDSSGDLVVRDANLNSVNDTSGNIRLEKIHGDLEIKDSSGDIHVRDMSGNLSIQDTSGRIDVRDVIGDVVIPMDSSGDIDIDTVTGLVTIKVDSSGSIRIENVTRDVTVHSDSSGDIRISSIQGSVKIGDDGSGNVRITKVDGDFTLGVKGSGNISTSGIKGKIDIPAKTR